MSPPTTNGRNAAVYVKRERCARCMIVIALVNVFIAFVKYYLFMSYY